MKNKHYIAVSCKLHSELELVIMHKNSIQLKLEDSCLIMKPHDIITQKGSGEFLVGRDENDSELIIRLDKIISWKNIENG